MKQRVFLIVALTCALSTLSFGTLVQSNLGGNVSTSGTFTGTVSAWQFSYTTSAAGFTSPTVAGDTLIIVVWATGTTNDTGGHSGEIGGTLAGSFASGFGNDGCARSQGYAYTLGGGAGASLADVQILCYPNAPSIPTSDTITATRVLNDSSTTGGAPVANTANAEFALFEFSNIIHSPFDTAGAGANSTGTPSTVEGGSATTSFTDLIFSAFISREASGTIGAGAGYALGLSSSVATIGQSEYQDLAPVGSYNGAFGGSEAYFAQSWIAIRDSSVGGVVKRHSGTVF